jgi:hypothetical protein
MQHKTIITDLVSLRGDVVDTEIVKQQRRSLWTEEQSLEARHVIQSYIWISYECGLVFVSIYRNRKSATSRSYSMFLRTAQVTGTHLVPSEFRTPQRNNILDIL